MHSEINQQQTDNLMNERLYLNNALDKRFISKIYESITKEINNVIEKWAEDKNG